MDNLPEWTDPFCWSAANEQWTEADEAIEEIREIRRQIFARFDNDIEKYCAYLMERQKRHGDRLINPDTLRQRHAAGDAGTTEESDGIAAAELGRRAAADTALKLPGIQETRLAGVG